jgi:hypothetical protein
MCSALVIVLSTTSFLIQFRLAAGVLMLASLPPGMCEVPHTF